MMHTSQVIRFMLLEQTYALSPKWLDATGNIAVDQVATASYNNIVSMLGLKIKSLKRSITG
jgi:hypothetical protein